MRIPLWVAASQRNGELPIVKSPNKKPATVLNSRDTLFRPKHTHKHKKQAIVAAYVLTRISLSYKV